MAKRSLDIILNGIDRTDKAFRSAETGMQRLTRTAKVAGATILAALSAREVIDFGKDIIGLASDAEEAASKFNFVFGSSAEDVTKRLDLFSDSAGRSRYELREMAGDFGALIRPMGFMEDQAADLSVELSKLATDLASFFNTTDEQALTALRAGLVGESEPLRKYGVQLSAARIEQEIFARGLANTKAQITPLMKAQASFNIIMQDTTAAQGDATRTAGSFANQVRDLRGEWVDFKTELGQEFLPVANDILTWINETTDALGGMANTIKLVIAEAKIAAFELQDKLTVSGTLRAAFGGGDSPLVEQAKRERDELLKDLQQQAFDREDARRGTGGNTRPDFGRPSIPQGVLGAGSANTLGLVIGGAVREGLRGVNLAGGISIDATRASVNDTGPGSATSGRFLTGVAQQGRNPQLEKISNLTEKQTRAQEETRDAIRALAERLGNSQPVLAGVFN